MALAANALPSSSAVFDVLVRAEGSAVVVTLWGEADLATLLLLVDPLARAIAFFDGPVVIDLAQADFIDSSTARVFCRARQFLESRGRRLTIRSPSRLATRVLGFFGLSPLVELDRTAEPVTHRPSPRRVEALARSAGRTTPCSSEPEPSSSSSSSCS
jgi:anti-anti-sigma factor